MTNTPATTKSAARKAAPKPKATIGKGGPHRPETPAKRTAASVKRDVVKALADEAKVVELAPKRARKTTAKSPATGESIVEAHPLVGASITIEQVDELGKAHDALTAATSAFEALVVELLQAGASPSHVGKAVGLGNSSIRRIGWRHGVGTPPPAQQR